jgi:hypothetical protein
MAIVSMFYIPWVATISVLWKDPAGEVGICIFEFVFALVLEVW